MSILTPAQIVIQTEEIAFNAAVAEDNLGRTGQTANFNSYYSHYTHSWAVNGAFGDQGATTRKDRPRPILWTSRLIGFIIALEQPDGVITSVQLQKATAVGGSPTNLLSTAASFSASAANDVMVGTRIRDYESDVQFINSTNCTTPIIDQAVNTVNFGDVVYLNITASGFSACNLSATAFFRPTTQV